MAHPSPPQADGALRADFVNARRIFRQYPDANIGIATGEEYGIFTIDEDTYKGGNIAEFGIELPETLTSVTGGGGKQLVFRYPADVVIKNSASRLSHAVDVRSDGGQFVVSPSIHKSGKSYQWVNPDAEINEAPRELVQLILERDKNSREETVKRYGQSALHHYGLNTNNDFVAHMPHKLQAKIEEGGRNDLLFREACALRDRGWTVDEIEAALYRINEIRCQPPLDDAEVQRIADSAGRYEPTQQLGSQVVLPDTGFTATTLGEMLTKEYQPEVQLIHSLPIGQIGYLNALPNGGKTLCLRNLSLCLATGRPYLQILDKHAPVRVVHLDLESTERESRDDLHLMMDEAEFTTAERQQAMSNIMVVTELPRSKRGGMIALSDETGMRMLENFLVSYGADVLLVDTQSQAFRLQNENDNSEVNNVVVTRLEALAKHLGISILVTHHVGKSGEYSNGSDMFKARGASAMTSVRCILNLDKLSGEDEDDLRAMLGYAKQKTLYKRKSEMLRCKQGSRWFVMTGETAEKKQKAIDKVIAAVTEPMRANEIVAQLASSVAQSSVYKYLLTAVSQKRLQHLEDGRYAPADYPNQVQDEGIPF